MADQVQTHVPETREQELIREEILDNMPEAVATRRARAARAEAQAREAARAITPEGRKETRRKLIVGAVLGLGAAARVLGRTGAARRPR
jgi:hypothetical protein